MNHRKGATKFVHKHNGAEDVSMKGITGRSGRRRGGVLRRFPHLTPRNALLAALLIVLLVALALCIMSVLHLQGIRTFSFLSKALDSFEKDEAVGREIPEESVVPADDISRRRDMQEAELAEVERKYLRGMPPNKVTSPPEDPKQEAVKIKDAAARRARRGLLPTHMMRPPYVELAHRRYPPLTVASLEFMAKHGGELELLNDATITALMRRERGQTTEEDVDLTEVLEYLYPPQQQAAAATAQLGRLLAFGTRVAGAPRESLLAYLVSEGLGTQRFSAAAQEGKSPRYIKAPHLSGRGRELLEALHAAATAGETTAHDEGAMDTRGWWWSLEWDNFTERSLVAMPGFAAGDSVTLRNLIFKFPGGSRFRTKAARLHSNKGKSNTKMGESVRADLSEEYAQEDLHSLDPSVQPIFGQPQLVKGKNSKVKMSDGSEPARPTKPTFAAPNSLPLTHQRLRHIVLSAHWDSKLETTHTFLGACDSLVPVAMLLRTIKGIAALTDVAEALAELYATEAREANVPAYTDDAGSDGSEKGKVEDGPSSPVRVGSVPGRNVLFKTRDEAEVREKLLQVVSPAHFALLFHYQFAEVYEDSRDRVFVRGPSHYNRPTGRLDEERRNPESRHVRRVDIRDWLDWVQHLPQLSVILFDGEEAFKEWEGDDNTYGSRHLARRWRSEQAAAAAAAAAPPGQGSESGTSRYDTVDLFVLYDLMGTAGTMFHNYFPTQSGIAYAELARLERERRQRALRDTLRVSYDLLHASGVQAMANEQSAKARHLPYDKVITNAYKGSAGPPREHVIPMNYARAVLRFNATPDSVPVNFTTSPLASLAKLPIRKDAFREELGDFWADTIETAASVDMPLPPAWLRYGSPHELYTLHGVPYEGHRNGHKDIRSLRQYHVGRLDGSRGYSEVNDNVFFSLSESYADRRVMGTPAIEDDHVHWLSTQRVLHMIPFPFPPSWHSPRDDGRDIDEGTTMDLRSILWEWTMLLGEGWTREKRECKAERNSREC